MMTFTSSRLKVFILLLLLVCVCYGNVLNGPLLFDDEHFIEKNPLIHSLKNIPQFFLSNARPDSNFYRPNQMVVNSLIYHFFKLNPVPYHAVSLILHFLNAFFVFTLLSQLSWGKKAATFASVIFLIHPIQTQAVSSIAGLSGPLGTFFLLWGIIQFVKSLLASDRRSQLYYLSLSCPLFIMALLCREDMVTYLPLSMIVSAYICSIHNKRITKHLVISLSLFGLIALVYLLLKFTAFNFSQSIGLTTERNLYTENLHIRLITFVNILWDYARMIIYPRHLHYEQPYLAYANLLSLRALFGVILISGFAWAALFFRKHQRIFLGLGWFLASLLPYTGIISLKRDVPGALAVHADDRHRDPDRFSLGTFRGQANRKNPGHYSRSGLLEFYRQNHGKNHAMG